MQKYYRYFYIALSFREKVFFESVALFERFKKLEKKLFHCARCVIYCISIGHAYS